MNESGDTAICFTVNQAKYLLKQVYKNRELSEIVTNDSLRIALCDSLVISKDKIICDLKKIDKNSILTDSIRTLEIASLKKQIKKDRLIKRALVAGNVVTFILVVWIKL